MFDSRIVNNTNNCNIIKHSLMDDLYPFTTDNSTIYYNNGISSSINFKSGPISELIQNSISNNQDNIWCPILVRSDRYIDNKMLSADGSYLNGNPSLTSGRIGIENFCYFTPQFKSWRLSRSSPMSIDWILNSHNTSYSIYYGIMAWVKKRTNVNKHYLTGNDFATIDKFPNGSRLIHSSVPNTLYIKLSDKELWSLDGDNIDLPDGESFKFFDQTNNKRIKFVDSFNDSYAEGGPKFKLANFYNIEQYRSSTQRYENIKVNLDNSLFGIDSNYTLWVADGDFLAHYDSESDRIQSEKYGIPSKSYISQSLYKFYTSIYRILTLDEPRNARINLRKLRYYRQLAHALSTSPFINEFSIMSLDTKAAKEIVSNYVNNYQLLLTTDSQIQFLNQTLIKLSTYFQKFFTNNRPTQDNLFDTLSLDTEQSPINLNNNLIRSTKQLFDKLYMKYGAELRISGQEESITSKLNLDNTGIALTQAINYYCDKSLNNTSVSNQETIFFDSTIVNLSSKEISTFDSTQNKSTLLVPLADEARPGFGDSSFFCPSLTYMGNMAPYSSEQANFESYIYKTNVSITPNQNDQTLIDLSNQEHALSLKQDGIELTSINIYESKSRSYNEPGMLEKGEVHYLEQNLSSSWEQISGPPGTFESIYGLGNIGNITKFYTAYTGKFIFRCTLSSPFGTYKKSRTIYVVDGRQTVPNFDGSPQPNILFGKYWDPNTSTWNYPPPAVSQDEATPIRLNIDNLYVTTSKVKKIAINNISNIIWPIDTDSVVREYVGNVGDNFITILEQIYKLQNDYKFSFPKIRNFELKQNVNLTLKFNPGNTTIRINSIFLEKIRNHLDDKCSQCLSMYLPNIKARKNSIVTGGSSGGTNSALNRSNVLNTIRTNKNPDGFSLVKYTYDPERKLYNGNRQDGYFGIDYPKISTDFAPKIKNYGGYSKSFIDTLGISIPSHPTLIPQQDRSIIGANNSFLPPVTGFKLDYRNSQDPAKYKFCYQKAIELTPTTGSIIRFQKGVFHTSSGWIPYTSDKYRIHANRCGVLKFNPGARDSFSFVGPKITQIETPGIDILSNTILPKTFSSSVTLAMADHIQWSPDCFCQASQTEDLSLQRYNDNQKHKEYIDTETHITDHGLRILHGGQVKPVEFTATNNYSIANDEFKLDQDTNNFTYSFAVTGPNNPPELVMGSGGKINIRNPRVNSFGIKDIEVKLNFLNYVNTKNLVIWLEVDFCGSEASSKFRSASYGSPPSPIKSQKEFIDQSYSPSIISGQWTPDFNSSINGSLNNFILEDYVKSITAMNSSSFGKPFKLFLLNQETIQNNTYNFSLKFSDSASKYNVLYDTDINRDKFYGHKVPSICVNQKIILNTEDVMPTLAASGYSDREACYYSNILKHNKINLTNNTLSKFFSSNLFQNAAPTTGPCPPEGAPEQKGGDYGGRTTFTLKMMVLDEADDMAPNDNIITSQFLSGLESADNKIKSDNIYNSLCNWELILHVGDVHKPVPYSKPSLESYGNVDTLSLLEYGNDPKYPGYSFISDLTAYKHLLPIANINAPYTCVADSNLCLTTQNDPTGQGIMVQPNPFPTWAIVNILASIAAYAGTTGGTLVGALGGLNSAINAPGYNAIYSWFAETAFIQGMEDAGRQVYFPSFAKYHFGSPEKILINFKKENTAWYTAEASIFKYHNSPILKPNVYQFRKLTKNTDNSRLSKFTFNVLQDYTALIDSFYIKNINLVDTEITIDSLFENMPPITSAGVVLYAGDIVDITIKIQDEIKVYRYVVSPKKINDSYGIKIQDLTGNNQVINLGNINYAFNYLQNNSILKANNNLFSDTLTVELSENKVILIDSRIPYDVLKINDFIDMLSQDDSNKQNKILKKALIFKNNRYQSVLVLENPVGDATQIAPGEKCNVFLVYKNQTTIEDEVTKKYNMWAFDYNKSFRHKLTPDILSNTHSVGSYGDLSIFIKKNLLTQNISMNNLESLQDILNNSTNDRIKYNKVKFLVDSNELQYDNRSIYGFTYSEIDLVPSVFDLQNESIIIKPEKNILSDTEDTTGIESDLKLQLKLSTTDSNTIPNGRFCIARIDEEFGGSIPAPSGNLEIENDYIEYIPIKILPQEDIDKLYNRIKVIDNTELNQTLERKVGNASETTSIISASNLFYLYKHLDALEDDPLSCQSQSSNNKSNCFKLKTQQKINDLIIEKSDIITVLDEQSVKFVNMVDKNNVNHSGYVVAESIDSISIYVPGDPDNSDSTGYTVSVFLKFNLKSLDISYKSRGSLPAFHPKKIERSILPKIDIKITYGTEDIKIEYIPANVDHYWINLDPNQSCIFDFAANPKILTQTEYSCIPTNPLVSNPRSDPFNHNICPQFLKNNPPAQDATSVESVKVGDKFFGNTLASTYTYKIPELKVESEKNRLKNLYPAITGWTSFTKERYFNINGDETIDPYPNDETTIASEEKYLIPLFKQDQVSADDKSADINFVPGIQKCQTDQDSLSGLGLLKSDGYRAGKPTRIKNIINLDNTNNIDVMIKRIPRMLRGVDLLATIYRYGSKNIYRQLNFNNPRIPYEIDGIGMQGALNNSIYCWVCLQAENNNTKINYSEVPDFFKLQNEMIFRSFFGSVDRIENKTDNLVSLFPWEMIPYEYGTK